ncbi:hypothetical protein BLSMQ_3557 [Brevibacterium aurantiacum]|uniref:Uncharacterized protein n=1 Tax=Brevibacterium aurantiacum TaxID=273384 RepID=A0A1D7W8G2_BREAU|nr:hypothetical protein BLSMQ_3557 [Brevibacterium aurantiacum]
MILVASAVCARAGRMFAEKREFPVHGGDRFCRLPETE